MLHQSQFIEMFGTPDNHPTEYAVKNLGDLSECYAGATPSTKVKEYWDNGTIPWMSSGEVHMGHVTETESKITESGYKHASTKMVPVHSVVIALAGQGKTRGTVAITEIPLCTNQSLCAIVPSKDIHYEYLYHNLKGRYLELRGMAGDVNGRGGLNLKIVQSIRVIVPPLSEQMRFVDIAQQADKSKFDGFKSQFIEMFGFPQDGADRYPSATIESLLQETISGEWGTDCTDESGTKVIRTTNFTNNGALDLTDVVVRTIDPKKVEKKHLKKGDIILEKSGGTKDNPVGRLVFFEEDGVYLANNFTQVLRPAENINSKYLFSALFYLYQTHKSLIKGLGNQTNGIQNLKVPQYLQLQICVPDRGKQDEFEVITRQADKSKYLN